MVASSIAFVLRNLPAILLVAALLIALLRRGGPEQYLAWILFLPIGVTGIWAALFHLGFPTIAASDIGWLVSPFQFEVGVADLAFGVTACIAAWSSLSFKAATVFAASIALLGDAVGHVRQMMIAGNFAPGNAGVPFWTDVIVPMLALALLSVAWRRGFG